MVRNCRTIHILPWQHTNGRALGTTVTSAPFQRWASFSLSCYDVTPPSFEIFMLIAKWIGKSIFSWREGLSMALGLWNPLILFFKQSQCILNREGVPCRNPFWVLLSDALDGSSHSSDLLPNTLVPPFEGVGVALDLNPTCLPFTWALIWDVEAEFQAFSYSSNPFCLKTGR